MADAPSFDSYDDLLNNADILALVHAQWLRPTALEPWDPDAARETCAEAVSSQEPIIPNSRSPLIPSAHTSRRLPQFNDCANNHYDNGNYPEALRFYAYALNILPEYSWAHCNRAAVHLAMDDVAAAVADYTAAIAIDSSDSALYNGRAFAALRTNCGEGQAGPDVATLKGALADVEQALALEEENGPAHCTKGAILKQLALATTNGVTDKAAAAAVGGEVAAEWTRLIDRAIGAQRRAISLEPEAQAPRSYLRDLLAMAGIDEQVTDAADWASSTRSIAVPKSPAKSPAATAGTGGGATGGEFPEGWLHKKGGLKDGERNWIKGGRRNWKVRWFAFDGEVIRWYDSKGGTELGGLTLTVFDRVESDPEK